jgi:hypothetical protein
MGIWTICMGAAASVESESAVESREKTTLLDFKGHSTTASDPCIMIVVTAIVLIIRYHIIFREPAKHTSSLTSECVLKKSVRDACACDA